MRSVLRVSALTLGLVAVGALALTKTGTAQADGEYLRVSPSTIQAGFQVEIDAYCGDNVNPATVSSDAFGVVTITPQTNPQTGKVSHRGTATVPIGTRPAGYQVHLRCPSQQQAMTTLHVVNFAIPSEGPHTGGGFLARSGTGGGSMIGIGGAVAGTGLLLLLLKARRRRAPA